MPPLARITGALAAACVCASAIPASPRQKGAELRSNRQWNVLPPGHGDAAQREQMQRAGERLGEITIFLAGKTVDGATLEALATHAPGEPFVRVVRESLGQAYDVEDLLLFLDDVLREGARGLRGHKLWMTGGRARRYGILLHPDDIFAADKPRLYGAEAQLISLAPPVPRKKLKPAKDGDRLGPRWYERYRPPRTRESRLRGLAKARPKSNFAERLRSLITQLEAQSAKVELYSTLRDRRRGYLMWGAFVLSRQTSARGVRRTLDELSRARHQWKINVPIRWRAPGSWRRTVETARQMAETFDVTYASRSGAMKSKHYDGVAADFAATGLPRQLTLRAPDGTQQSFDLSAPDQARDLNLSPDLIDWIEPHFGLKKLREDYGHWEDARVEAEF